jgi:hypothetical protein
VGQNENKPGDFMAINTFQPYQTQIGFLRVPYSIPFEGGELVLLPEYDSRAAYIETRTHRDGFFYPLESHTYNFDSFELNSDQSLFDQGELIPNTRRPMPFYQLPASHCLNLTHTRRSDNPQLGDAALILHAIGFAYRVRLQFSDGWFDSRISISARKAHLININDASDFISSAYHKWKEFSYKNQRLATNLLWMATRLESYEKIWEQFAFSYMILDGCYKLAVDECGLKKTRKHKECIAALCTHFAIFYDERHQEFIERIVGLRNSLFHELLWADQVMGSAGTPHDIYTALHLQKLYQRILAAILDFKGEFTHSPWTYLLEVPFSRHK